MVKSSTSKTAEGKDSMTSSILSEDDSEDFRFGCDQCWFAAETQEELSEHEAAKHPDEMNQLQLIQTLSVHQNLSKESRKEEKINKTEHLTEMNQLPVQQSLSKESKKEEEINRIMASLMSTVVETNNGANDSKAIEVIYEKGSIEGAFQCHQCWSVLSSNEELSQHISNVHEFAMKLTAEISLTGSTDETISSTKIEEGVVSSFDKVLPEVTMEEFIESEMETHESDVSEFTKESNKSEFQFEESSESQLVKNNTQPRLEVIELCESNFVPLSEEENQDTIQVAKSSDETISTQDVLSLSTTNPSKETIANLPIQFSLTEIVQTVGGLPDDFIHETKMLNTPTKMDADKTDSLTAEDLSEKAICSEVDLGVTKPVHEAVKTTETMETDQPIITEDTLTPAIELSTQVIPVEDSGTGIQELDLKILEDESDPSTDSTMLPNAETSGERFIIECSLCGFSTGNPEEMEKHLGWEGHFSLGQENICQHCTFMSTSKEELLEHGLSHCEDFTFSEYFCSKCSHKTNSLERIEQHLKESHKI